MEMEVQPNDVFTKAASFVMHTDKSIFLTGKAGTGKTTFLKYIQENCPKKIAVAAPTGVAAINAGGTTLHSLFHLPFGTYIKNYQLRWDEHDNHIYNRQRLLAKIKLSVERRTLLQELELLIIDEVSMLRADMFDAIDDILKSVRRDMRPFGGLQVLLIGDLYQLPPVVKQHEWLLMQTHYASPFFFDSMAINDLKIIQIELKKIYRQSDDIFINLLNDIRNNCCSNEQIDFLNSHYKEDFNPQVHDAYITLCSHNSQADQINQQRLKELQGKTVAIEALVTGDYSESAYPAENILQLKEGAQVMFIKNDKGLDKRYYNGKIGFIKGISGDKKEICVSFTDGSEDVYVTKEEWKNVKFNYDKVEDKIKEETLGTFSQFPLRLAWAVTIHKSQGLTFDHAMIDAGAAFAAGQVYVALSRIRSLDGLVLKSRISLNNIFTNQHVVRYSKNALADEDYDQVLQEAQHRYLLNLLLTTFDWNNLSDKVKAIKEMLLSGNVADKEEANEFLSALSIAISMHREVANKFKIQLSNLIVDATTDKYARIDERSQKAADWFVTKLEKQAIDPLESHIKLWSAKKRSKKYIENLKELLIDNYRKLDRLKKCKQISAALSEEIEISLILNQAKDLHKIAVDKVVESEVSKPLKGATKNISLDFFKEGKSISEIATIRGLTEGTITNHLISFIGIDVDPAELIETDKLNKILRYLEENPTQTTSEIKYGLGGDFSYTDIKVAQQVLTLPTSHSLLEKDH